MSIEINTVETAENIFKKTVRRGNLSHSFLTMAMTTTASTLTTEVWAGYQLRYVTEADGTLWFALSDMCKALELDYQNSAVARWNVNLRRMHSQKVRTGKLRNARGQLRDGTMVEESLVYAHLVPKSRKPAALKFQNWVGEMIKQIRQTGSYSVVQRSLEDLQLDRQERRVALAERRIAVEERRLAVQKERRLLLNAPERNVRDVEEEPAVDLMHLKTLRQLLVAHGYKGRALKMCMGTYAGKVSSAYRTARHEAPTRHPEWDVNLYSDEDWPLVQGVVAKGQTGLGGFFKARK